MSAVGSLMKIAKTLNGGTPINAAGIEEALEFIASKVGTGAGGDAGDYALKVNFSDDSDAVVCDTDYEDIKAAIEAGRDVAAFYGGLASTGIAYDGTNNTITADFVSIASTTLTKTAIVFAKAGTITKTEADYTLTAAV
ncbi:MAG: hypothetical protein IKE28_11905 [Solobacterium sp.]|nr:hypothetical protein [Solobacterium sp.]